MGALRSGVAASACPRPAYCSLRAGDWCRLSFTVADRTCCALKRGTIRNVMVRKQTEAPLRKGVETKEEHTGEGL